MSKKISLKATTRNVGVSIVRATLSFALLTFLACGAEHADSAESNATVGEALSNQPPAPPELGWRPLAAAPKVGTLPGGGRVGPNGEYSYTLPIDVPPGRAGAQPSLSLTYSSMGGNGLLGVGWELRGLSAIHACDQSIATDGAAASSNVAKLCLDGERLVDTPDGFRTEQDSFARIEAESPAVWGPGISAPGIVSTGFKVWLKDGRIRHYSPTVNDQPPLSLGCPADRTPYKEYCMPHLPAPAIICDNPFYPPASLPCAGNDTCVYGFDETPGTGVCGSLQVPTPVAQESFDYFPLALEEDRDGNLVTYEYYATGDRWNGGREVYPTLITYTGKKTAEKGRRSVKFTYTNTRPDPVYQDIDYSGALYPGKKSYDEETYPNERKASTLHKSTTATTVLLQTIEVSAPTPTTGTTLGASAIAWSYTLGYDPSPTTKQSMLTSVTKTGALGGTVYAKKFHWQSDASAHAIDPNAFGLQGVPEAFTVVDVDNNGLDEILYHIGGKSAVINSMQYGTPQAPLANSKVLFGLEQSTANAGRVADLDGDGVPEVIAPEGAAIRRYNWDQTTQDYTQSSGSPWAPMYEESKPTQSQPVFFADMDGDGLPDLFQARYEWPSDLPDHSCDSSKKNCGGYDWYFQHNDNGLFSSPAGALLSSHEVSAAEAVQTHDFGNYDISSVDGSFFRPRFASSSTQSIANYMVVPDRDGAIAYLAMGHGGHFEYAVPGGDLVSGEIDEQGVPYGFSMNRTDSGISYFYEDDPTYSNPLCGIGNYKGTGKSSECLDLKSIGSPPLFSDQSWKVVNFDLDADGRDDLIAYASPSLIVPVMLPGTAWRISYDATGTRSQTPLTNIPVVTGDFNGDGLPDALFLSTQDGALHLGIQTKATRDLLTEVVDDTALNASEIVTYSQKWSPDPVEPMACIHPQRCLRRGFNVAVEHDVWQGESAGYQHSMYSYDDPRYDVHGRGFLGFGAVIVWDPDRPSATITIYDNVTSVDSPLPSGPKDVYKAQLPASIVQMVPVSYFTGQGQEPVTVRVTTTTMANVVDFTNGGRTYFAHLQSSTTVESEDRATLDWEATVHHFTGFPSVPNVLRQRVSTVQFDPYGNVTDSTEVTVGGVSRSSHHDYDYDTSAWLVAKRAKTVVRASDANNSPVVQTVDYTHDALGHVHIIQAEKTSADPEVPETTTIFYNTDGLPFKTVRSTPLEADRTTYVEYDADEGIFPRVISNDLHHESVLYHPAFGVIVDAIDENSVESTSWLDDLGRVRMTQEQGNPAHHISLSPRTDSAGHLVGTDVQTTGVVIATTTQSLDARGRTVRMAHTAFDGTTNVQAWTFDVLGRLSTESLPFKGGVSPPANTFTRYTYDALDRRLQTDLPDGSWVIEEHDFWQSMRQDGENHRTVVTRDVDGRVSWSTQQTSTKPVSISYTYEPMGDQLTTSTDSMGNTTTIFYDQRRRRSKIVDPDTGTQISHYNGFGEVRSTQATNGDTTTYKHDLLGRVYQETSVDKATLVSSVTTTNWDTAASGVGRIGTRQSPDGVVEAFAYDTNGRMVQRSWKVDGEAFDVVQTYDLQGRPATLAYPEVPGMSGASRLTVARSYDTTASAQSYVASVSMVSPSPYTFWTVNARDEGDRLISGTQGNQLVETRGYYPLSERLSTVVDTKPCAPKCSTVIFSLAYTYWNDGLVHTRTDKVLNRSEEFQYDAFHRLTSWQLTDGDQPKPARSYNYDDIGNLSAVLDGTTTTETNTYKCTKVECAGPHALMMTTGAAGLSQTYHYDSRGRQWTAVGSATNRSVVYTDRDLPASLKTSTASMTFKYDAAGSRVKKTDANGNETLTLDGMYERRKIAGGNVHIFYVPGTDGVLAQYVYDENSQTGKAEYVHRDRLGSTIGTTDGTATVQRYFHEPFGARIQQNGAPLAPGALAGDVAVGFTGQEMDDDLGLINMKGRIYDPAQRHFLSADPLVTRPFNQQTYNRYSYVHNNATNLTDPSGFDSDSGTDSGSGGEDDGGGGGGGYGIGNGSGSGGRGGCHCVNAGHLAFHAGPCPPVAPSGASTVGQEWMRVANFQPAVALTQERTAANLRAMGLHGLAEVAEAGGCSWCHATKDSQSLEEANAKIDPQHFRNVSTGLGVLAAAFQITEVLAHGAVPDGVAKGATGTWGGRTFDTLEAGGPVRNLSTNRVRITPRGIDAVEEHLARFGPYAPNEGMVARLRSIAEGKLVPEPVDLNFYTHELRESVRYRQLGFRIGGGEDYDLWNNAHSATLADYGLVEGPGVLYHPSVAQ